MAIINTETKARGASSGYNKPMRFNVSNQQGSYQGLVEDAIAFAH